MSGSFDSQNISQTSADNQELSSKEANYDSSNSNEKESILNEYKEEMKMAAKAITNLRNQIRDLANQQLPLGQSNSGSIDHFGKDSEQLPLQDMIQECSTFLRSISEEIKDMNTKSTQVLVSNDVVGSYMSSVQNEATEVQFEKDQYLNRMLSSLASVVYVGDLPDSSMTAKMGHVEKCLSTLIENYNWFLYQSDQLRQCLREVRSDLPEQNDHGVIFSAANDELLGLRKKEAGLVEKLSLLGKENNNLMEELERLRAEFEQERQRFSNTKEKLALAVTKGKALVQQRESWKQSLANKTSELEECLTILKEKSIALEVAEVIKEELVKNQISSSFLQEMLAQSDSLLEKLEDMTLQSSLPEGLKSKDVTERMRWLLADRNALKDESLKYHQFADILLSIHLPQNISFSDIGSRLSWLMETFTLAKAQIGALQDENVKMRETAYSEMDCLTALLSTVLVEKDYLKMEMESTSHKFGAIFQRENEASLGNQNSLEAREDILPTLQEILYVKLQELALYEDILEEETHMSDRVQVSEGQSTIKSLENTVAVSEEKIHQLVEEKREREAAQVSIKEQLKVQVQDRTTLEKELTAVKRKVIDMEAGLDRIIQNFASINISGDQSSVAMSDRVQVLELLVKMLILESKTFKSSRQKHESGVDKSVSNEKEIAELKGKLLDMEEGVKRIIQHLGGDTIGKEKPVGARDLVKVLEELVTNVTLELGNLKSRAKEFDVELGEKVSIKQELAKVQSQLFDLEAGLQRIVQKMRGDMTLDKERVAATDLIQILEKTVMGAILESENSKSKVHELDTKLLASQKAVDQLLSKVKALEDSLQSRAVPPETVKERSIFETPSPPYASDITEIEDVVSASKPTVSPVASAHVRMARKGSSDHIAVNIDSESSRLIDKEEAVEDKGHVFKSLIMSGLVPKQGRMIADRVDGIWVSSDRLLRSRPGVRLGLIAYWLFLHIWFLGAIL